MLGKAMNLKHVLTAGKGIQMYYVIVNIFKRKIFETKPEDVHYKLPLQ